MLARLEDYLPSKEEESPYFSDEPQIISFVADVGCISDDVTLFIFHILFEILGGDRATSHYVALGALRLVSREWNSLLCSHSEFWGRLSLTQDEAGWDVILKYNSAGILNVFATLVGQGWPYTMFVDSTNPTLGPDPKATRFLELLKKETKRIKTLDFSYDGEQVRIEDIIQLICSPAAIMEMINLRTTSRLADSSEPRLSTPIGELFHGQAPMLRSVEICSEFKGAETIPVLLGGNLEHLHLENVRRRIDHQFESHRPALNFLPEALRQSARLNSIKLIDCTLFTPLLAVTEPILLNKLRSIIISNCDENLAILMFQIVETRPCSKLVLHTGDQLSARTHQVVSQRLADNFMPWDGHGYHRSLYVDPYDVIRSPSGRVFSQYNYFNSPNDGFGLASVLHHMGTDVKSKISSIFLFQETCIQQVLAVIHESVPHLSELGLDCRGRPGRPGANRYRPRSTITPLVQNREMLGDLTRLTLMGTKSQTTSRIPHAVEILRMRQENRVGFESEKRDSHEESDPLETPVATLVLGQESFLDDAIQDSRLGGVSLEFAPWLDIYPPGIFTSADQ